MKESPDCRTCWDTGIIKYPPTTTKLEHSVVKAIAKVSKKKAFNLYKRFCSEVTIKPCPNPACKHYKPIINN